MVDRLPILTFHDIDDRRSVISIPPGVFRRGVARLHECGYRTLSLLEVVEHLRRGMPFPNRSLAITFDDGYQAVYTRAFPVLRRHGMTATVFLTVGTGDTPRAKDRLPALNGRTMLSWNEIREMHQMGFAFGAHTLAHPDLPRLPADRIEAEICHSQAIIADALGAPVDCFAYPYGRYDDRSRAIVRQHFACACSDTLALVTSDSDPFTLERVDAYYLRTDRLFEVLLTRLFPGYIWMRGTLRRARRAVRFDPRRP